MKLLSFFLSLCIVGSLYAAEPTITKCEKTYVLPNQIYFVESVIFIQINNLWIQPISIQTDALGLYFNEISYNERTPGPWQCKKKGCNTWNEEWRDYCKNCGYSRS